MYQLHNCDGAVAKVLERISNFILHFTSALLFTPVSISSYRSGCLENGIYT